MKSIKHFFSYPWACFVNHSSTFLSSIYQRIVVPPKVKKMRRKTKIKVVFIIEELSSWKTEELYLLMKKHPRFAPILLIMPDGSADYASEILTTYLSKRKYEYSDLKPGERIWKKFHPDIIFYQKPYGGILPSEHFFQYNLKSLMCYVPYSFRNRCHPGLNNMVFQFYNWQLYAENDMIIKELEPVLLNKACNFVVTGLPIMDELLKDKTEYANPWKLTGKKLKRIIYAPHHTISSEVYKSPSPYDYSTFFEYAEYMVTMAEKYKDKVQWAFKPHPLLKVKLYKIWGKEKTDAYYKKWVTMVNCQLEQGEYIGLFKHSDAMIHDCGSFKIEYLYTGNPVMYLNKEDLDYDYPNWQTRKAIELHYKANQGNDIEMFIRNVIKGEDVLKEKRDNFVQEYLTPPNGRSASENIINAILGKDKYK